MHPINFIITLSKEKLQSDIKKEYLCHRLKKFGLGTAQIPMMLSWFYALAKGLIPTDPYEIVHVIEDIETLNRRALAAELEVTAISVHAYAYVAKDYVFTPCGASIGDQYGPLVVSRHR